MATTTDEKHNAALSQMRAQFAAEVSSAAPTTASISMWRVDDFCLLRYLRARSFDVIKAAAMLRATLDWRRSFGLDHIRSSDWRRTIEFENSTGKMYVRGLDREGHAVVYMKPGRENSTDFDGNMKHLVFNLEAAAGAMAADGRMQEKMLLIIDYDNWSLSNAPPMKTSLETLHILQNHYPERLYKAVILNQPWLLGAFWTAISPFIDPVTKAKIVMLPHDKKLCTAKLLEFVHEDVLESGYGGNASLPFDSSAYLRPYYSTTADAPTATATCDDTEKH